MKRSPALVVSLVLLGASAIFITRLLLENFQLKVELANLKTRPAAQVVPAPRPAPPTAAAAPARATAPAGAAAGANDPLARNVIESARQMMNDALVAEAGPEKKMWIRVDPRDREAATFADQISAVFKEAGWDVKELDNEGMRFKAGLMFLVGSEDDPPSYVLTAQKAVEAIGQEVMTGRGYLSYYEQKKRDTPEWQGTRFLPDQTFVLLVGRRPEPKPASTEGQ